MVKTKRSGQKKLPETPPRTIKVPDIGSPEGEDESVGSVATTSSVRSGIPFHVCKRLAQDIESNKVGGIQALVGLPPNSQHIAQLLDLDEVYGPRGGELRIKLGKKVHYWKKLHNQGVYESRVLAFYGVAFYGTLRQKAVNHSISEDDLSDLEVYILTPEKPRRTKQQDTPQKPKQTVEEKMMSISKQNPGSRKFPHMPIFLASHQCLTLCFRTDHS
jgi:hypothetical protein